MLKTLIYSATGAGLALALAVGASAAADTTPPKAVDILFETKHIMSIAPGTLLLYKFERKPSNEKILGAGFNDDIKVKIESDGAPGKKNVVVEMFTGERAIEPNHITDMDGNPVLIVFLDTALGHFNLLAGGDRAYLKHRFSDSFAKPEAKVDPVKISYNGADVDGYRVTVTPFLTDPSRAKMRGFETSVFSLVLSDKIPGYFAKMVSNYTNSQKDAPSLDEQMTLEGVGDIK